MCVVFYLSRTTLCGGFTNGGAVAGSGCGET